MWTNDKVAPKIAISTKTNVIFNSKNVYSQAITDARNNPEKYEIAYSNADRENENYNCHECAIEGSRGNDFHNNDPLWVDDRNEIIDEEYESGTVENATFGESIVTWGEDHTSVFFGVSQDGTVYVFNKIGNNLAPSINKASETPGAVVEGGNYGAVRDVEYLDNNTVGVDINQKTGTKSDGSQGTGIYNKKKE